VSAPINDGGPAFPHMADLVSSDGKGGINTRQITSGGMSLRDWFAGQAMQGYLAAGNDWSWRDSPIEKSVAEESYLLADAMLAARERKESAT